MIIKLSFLDRQDKTKRRHESFSMSTNPWIVVRKALQFYLAISLGYTQQREIERCFKENYVPGTVWSAYHGYRDYFKQFKQDFVIDDYEHINFIKDVTPNINAWTYLLTNLIWADSTRLFLFRLKQNLSVLTTSWTIYTVRWRGHSTQHFWLKI